MTKLFFEKDLEDPNCWVARDGRGTLIGTIHRVERRGWFVSHPVEAGQDEPAPGVAVRDARGGSRSCKKAVA